MVHGLYPGGLHAGGCDVIREAGILPAVLHAALAIDSNEPDILNRVSRMSLRHRS